MRRVAPVFSPDAQRAVPANVLRRYPIPLQVASLSLGPYGTNCWIVRPEDAADCVVIDPGEEPERVLAALRELGCRCAAILVTHAHLDHIGAVGAVAREATCPVYTSAGDAAVLRDINDHLWAGAGPYVPHDPEGRLVPGEQLELAGMAIDVFDTPGHRPDAVSLLLTGPDGSQVLAAGDVLFAGSVGRTDLEGGDWDALEASIRALVAACEPDTAVLPGHGPATTLRQELATNPFLGALRA